MPSIQILLAFFTASSILALIPGPDNIFTLTQSMLYGKRAGFIVILGLCTGLIFHTSMVALGLALIFQNSLLAFNLLKTAGSLYLLWLALQAFLSAPADMEKEEVKKDKRNLKFYTSGLIMSISNPKLAIFFLAFLPQFTSDQGLHISLQIFFLGFLFMLATLIIFTGIALMAASFKDFIGSSDKKQRYLQYIAGIIFLLLALGLINLKH